MSTNKTFLQTINDFAAENIGWFIFAGVVSFVVLAYDARRDAKFVQHICSLIETVHSDHFVDAKTGKVLMDDGTIYESINEWLNVAIPAGIKKNLSFNVNDFLFDMDTIEGRRDEATWSAKHYLTNICGYDVI